MVKFGPKILPFNFIFNKTTLPKIYATLPKINEYESVKMVVIAYLLFIGFKKSH